MFKSIIIAAMMALSIGGATVACVSPAYAMIHHEG